MLGDAGAISASLREMLWFLLFLVAPPKPLALPARGCQSIPVPQIDRRRPPRGRCVSSPRHLLAGSPSPCLSCRLLMAPMARNRPGTASGIAECWAGRCALAGQAPATAAGKAWHRGTGAGDPRGQTCSGESSGGLPVGFGEPSLEARRWTGGIPALPPRLLGMRLTQLLCILRSRQPRGAGAKIFEGAALSLLIL